MIPKNSYPKSSLIMAESQTGKGDVAPIWTTCDFEVLP